jgi:hypothetical protein
MIESVSSVGFGYTDNSIRESVQYPIQPDTDFHDKRIRILQKMDAVICMNDTLRPCKNRCRPSPQTCYSSVGVHNIHVIFPDNTDQFYDRYGLKPFYHRNGIEAPAAVPEFIQECSFRGTCDMDKECGSAQAPKQQINMDLSASQSGIVNDLQYLQSVHDILQE